jgi:hypothetical protein
MAETYDVWITRDEERRETAPPPELPPLGPLRPEDIDRRPATARELTIIEYQDARTALAIAAVDFSQHVRGDGAFGRRRWPGSQKKLMDAADRYAHAQQRMQQLEDEADDG